jgi:hypothetical protein
MNLSLHAFAALTAATAILVSAPAAFAQTAAQGIEPVIGGTSPLGPVHGYGQGTWTAPGLAEGRVYAKLYDTRGLEQFTLDATLIQYLFFVAAPAQGEISGQLLIPHVAAGQGVALPMAQVYAAVEGTWIETSNGRGAFVASILQPSAAPSGPLVQVGIIQGSFQLRPVQAGIQPTLEALATTSGAGSAANGQGHLQPVPPLVVLPGAMTAAGHGMQMVDDDLQRRPMNHHGGLGQVGQGGSGTAFAVKDSNTEPASRGRLTLRWQLF